MWILSATKDIIRNLDGVNSIYLGTDGKVVCSSVSGPTFPIGYYETSRLANVAIRMISERIYGASQETTLVKAPTLEEVKRRDIDESQDKTMIHHYHDGSKTKSHGGS